MRRDLTQIRSAMSDILKTLSNFTSESSIRRCRVQTSSTIIRFTNTLIMLHVHLRRLIELTRRKNIWNSVYFYSVWLFRTSTKKRVTSNETFRFQHSCEDNKNFSACGCRLDRRNKYQRSLAVLELSWGGMTISLQLRNTFFLVATTFDHLEANVTVDHW